MPLSMSNVVVRKMTIKGKRYTYREWTVRLPEAPGEDSTVDMIMCTRRAWLAREVGDRNAWKTRQMGPVLLALRPPEGATVTVIERPLDSDAELFGEDGGEG